MADQSNSKSPFSFPEASKGLFGSQATSAPTTGGFSSTAAPATASIGGGLFGASTGPRASDIKSAPTGGLFGGSGGGKAVDGKSDQPAASGGPTFGQFTTGNAFSSAQTGQPASSASSGSIFSTPNKPADAGAASTNIFGAASGGGGLFGSKTSSAVNNTTPTSKPNLSLFGNSTTPAGPPPGAGNGAGSSTLFSFSKPEASSSGNAEASSTKPSTPSLFSSLNAPPANSNKPQSSQAPSQASNFFSLSSNNSSMASGQNQTSQQTTSQGPSQVSNLFSLPPNNSNNASSQNPIGQPQGAASRNSNEDKSTPSLFQSLGRQTASSSASTPSLFPSVLSQPQASAAPGVGLFGSFGGSNATAGTGSAAATSDGLKASVSNPQDNSKNTATTSASTSGPPAASTSNVFSNFGKSAAPPSGAPTTSASSVFGNFGKAAALSSVSEPQDPPAIATADASKSTATHLGASTSGPAPPARSRLKDKTMDDIITRWASDLSKYQKDFQSQAEQVASWDRILVENSEKIQRLYGSTLEAERATTEVERQLTSVESDQAELEAWLNHYETEVDNMIQIQVGKSDGLTGPDQERERTYQLATRLSDRLDDMGKDLGSMIEEINDASSNLSKHSKSDDPLTQVVRVLNSHLTQLQQIDQGAARLQLKVKEAQRVGNSIRPSNGLNGPSSDAAEAFYRSFMGR